MSRKSSASAAESRPEEPEAKAAPEKKIRSKQKGYWHYYYYGGAKQSPTVDNPHAPAKYQVKLRLNLKHDDCEASRRKLLAFIYCMEADKHPTYGPIKIGKKHRRYTEGTGNVETYKRGAQRIVRQFKVLSQAAIRKNKIRFEYDFLEAQHYDKGQVTIYFHPRASLTEIKHFADALQHEVLSWGLSNEKPGTLSRDFQVTGNTHVSARIDQIDGVYQSSRFLRNHPELAEAYSALQKDSNAYRVLHLNLPERKTEQDAINTLMLAGYRKIQQEYVIEPADRLEKQKARATIANPLNIARGKDMQTIAFNCRDMQAADTQGSLNAWCEKLQATLALKDRCGEIKVIEKVKISAALDASATTVVQKLLLNLYIEKNRTRTPATRGVYRQLIMKIVAFDRARQLDDFDLILEKAEAIQAIASSLPPDSHINRQVIRFLRRHASPALQNIEVTREYGKDSSVSDFFKPRRKRKAVKYDAVEKLLQRLKYASDFNQLTTDESAACHDGELSRLVRAYGLTELASTPTPGR